ncbi:MAG: type II toxin-antitoxin system VapC family toxin, partial [Patescibacteria group bacterium]|nr:type II toxin-antitoxin system VapC family toxin [Patescibacteria group bacterium]
MKTLVIDTSVIVKWINTHKEKDTEKADKILNEVKNGQVELLAPELAKYELGNVLLKGKQLIPSEAYISLGTVYSLPITFVAESEEMSK